VLILLNESLGESGSGTGSVFYYYSGPLACARADPDLRSDKFLSDSFSLVTKILASNLPKEVTKLEYLVTGDFWQTFNIFGKLGIFSWTRMQLFRETVGIFKNPILFLTTKINFLKIRDFFPDN